MVETFIIPRDISLIHPQLCYQLIFCFKSSLPLLLWNDVIKSSFLSINSYFWIWIVMEKPDWQYKYISNFENGLSITIDNPIQQIGLQYRLSNPYIQSSNTLHTGLTVYKCVIIKCITIQRWPLYILLPLHLCRLFFH